MVRSRRGIPKRRSVTSAHIENRRRMPQQTKKAVVDNRGLRNPPACRRPEFGCNFLRRQRIGQDAGKRNGQYRHGADQGRDCGAAEIHRIAKNAACWPDMKASRQDVIANVRAKLPISNKLLGTRPVKFPFPLASKAKRAPSRAWALNNATSLCRALANPKPPDSARQCRRGHPGVRHFRASKSNQRRETGAG